MALTKDQINAIFQEYGRKGAGAQALERFRNMDASDVYEFLDWKVAGTAPAPSWVGGETTTREPNYYTDLDAVSGFGPSGGGQSSVGADYANEVEYLRTLNPIDLTDQQGLQAYGPQWAMLKGTDYNNAVTQPDSGLWPQPPAGYTPPPSGGGDPFVPPVTQPPVTGGGDVPIGGGDTGGGGGDPWNPGSPTTGNPGGGGGTGGWNWEAFNPGAPPLDGGGGYDPNDYAFDRYVPGQESPWGIPEAEGGNRDFYRNQFVNLLRQDQNFQNKQRDAAAIRQDAIDNPITPNPSDWSWLEGGLPDVVTGSDSSTQPTWDWDIQGLSNQQLFDQAAPTMSEQNQQWLQNNWLTGDDVANSMGFSQTWGDANDFMQTAQGYEPGAQVAWTDFADSVGTYTPGFSSTIPAGYASPNPNMQFGSDYGYQQGGASSFYNPITGAWGATPAGGI